MTGYPWHQGDPLLAADLNAAFANMPLLAGAPFLPLSGGAVSGATSFGSTVTLHADPGSALEAATRQYVDAHVPAGGPFLPLSGGTVTGPTTVSAPLSFGPSVQTASITGGAALSPSTTQGWQQNAGLSGSNSTAGVIAFNQWNVSSDTLAKTGNVLFHTAINYNFGGGAYTGARSGFLVNMTQVGAAPGGGTQGALGGIQASCRMTNTWGGTNLSNNAVGAVATFNGYVAATSGYTNGQGGSGMEIDIEMQAGCSFRAVTGVLITQTSAHAVSGAAGDSAIQLNNQFGATAGWDWGVYFGAGAWPMASNSTLFFTERSAVGAMPTAANGIDIQQCTFSGAAYRSSGFSVDGTGNVRTGTVYLNNSATGGSLDASGSIVTAVALVSGGSSWPTDGNPHYATDLTNGGVYNVGISAGGVVNAVLIANPSVVKGATPANPVTLTPSKRASAWGATNITVNLTWSTRKALVIQPAGGALSIAASATAFGSGTQNIMSITPGAAAGSNIVFSESGTGQFEFDGIIYANAPSGTDIYVRSTIGLGLGVAANSDAYISTPNGSHINLNPQGSASVKVLSDLRVTGKLGVNNAVPLTKPTGYSAPTGTATRATFVTSSVTLSVLAEHVKALIDDLTLYGLIGP